MQAERRTDDGLYKKEKAYNSLGASYDVLSEIKPLSLMEYVIDNVTLNSIPVSERGLKISRSNPHGIEIIP
jgi:hypothetical protein